MPGLLVESPVWRLQFQAETQDDLVRVTELIAEDCRVACPVDKGEMKATIRTTYEPGSGFIHVGTDHWAPTEYGSLDHAIRPRPSLVSRDGNTATYRGGGVLAFFWEREGRFVFFRKVHHPGTPAQSFMRVSLFRHRVL